MRAMLHRWALYAIWIGGFGAISFLLRTGYREGTPGFLLTLIGAWVISPFVILLLLMGKSKHWTVMLREVFYVTAIVIGVGTLAIYLRVALVPLRAKPAVPFVAVPPLSVLVLAISLFVAWVISRRTAHS